VVLIRNESYLLSYLSKRLEMIYFMTSLWAIMGDPGILGDSLYAPWTFGGVQIGISLVCTVNYSYLRSFEVKKGHFRVILGWERVKGLKSVKKG